MTATWGSNCSCHEAWGNSWCGRCHSTVPVIDRMTRGAGPSPSRQGLRVGDWVGLAGERWQVWCWGTPWGRGGTECVFLVTDGGRWEALAWGRHQANKLRGCRIAAADEPLPLELVS